MRTTINIQKELSIKAVLEDELEDEEGDDYIPTEPVVESETPKVQKHIEKKTEEVKTQPAPKALPSAKPVKEEPKFLDEEPEEEVTVEEIEKASPVEEKPKTARVKRLFRGLRKKS